MSGGERQRVAIARAMANDPDVILADEPTGNLDTETGIKIMEMLEKLNNEKGKTIIVVTHDPRLTKYADRVIKIMDGVTNE
jgi:putative ABC transport system ATP-binding protein